ncbi:epoxide hydrolase family protein [Nocardia sp. NPDC058658]|uniref:epoxide hydrolase family protein n=1 Tax=Nocardia sp. NPDC058658 TaxID=3346580 RepID=UPI00365CD09A
MTTDITPFSLHIPDSDLDDLTRRLAGTRLLSDIDDPAPVDVGIPIPAGWEYGVPVAYLRPLLDKWREFDWRAQEQRLNAVEQFTTEIDGQTVHFAHVRSPEPDAVPLLMLHGWPSSFVEFLGVIPQLTDPRADDRDPSSAFHLVIPSYPGFPLSGPTHTSGWNPQRMAEAMIALMTRLGYDRFGLHGNDAGAIIAPEIGRLAPENVIGIHVDQIFSFPVGAPGEFDDLGPDDYAALEFGQNYLQRAIHDSSQRAQPHTVAHGLSDSPAGQLAWLAQLLAHNVSDEDLLTNAALYWFTNTSASSARFYFESAHTEPATEPTTVPIGLAAFGDDFTPPRKFADRDHQNLVHWREYSEGGHWAAYQVPHLLADDIRDFFAKVV